MEVPTTQNTSPTLFVSPWPRLDIPEISITQLILNEVKKYGKSVAVFDAGSGKEYTYDEIVDKVHKVAGSLAARGFKKGDIMAILLPNCAEYIFAYYAVAMIGGTITTANPLYTATELAFQLKDSRASYMITCTALLPQVKEANEKVQGLKEIYLLDSKQADGITLPFSVLLEKDHPVPKVEINSKKDIVALPYSSGTTGLPKGVELTHYNLVSNVLQLRTVEPSLQHYKGDTLIGFLPFFHIYGLSVIMNSGFYLGCKIVIMPKFDMLQFLELIQTHKVTYVHLAPPVALGLVKHPAVAKYDLSSVTAIVSGAAPLSADLEVQLKAKLGNHVIIKQGYGMTEAAPVTHFTLLSFYKPGSVGWLFPNMEAKVVDIATGEALPANKEGEICVRGPNVMLGYLNNPTATQNTIDKDNFLHTGDVGYVDDDGFYFIVDRVKELIKYKGFQVAPAELEGLLMSHPSIADAAVIGLPDDEAGELPKAFIVVKPGLTIKDEEIHQYIEPKVAHYKRLRGGIEVVDAIPKSASGKILRRVLKDKEKAKKAAAKV